MAWYHRISNAFRRDNVHHDVDREAAFHLQERIDELRATGLSERDATVTARRRFGNRTAQIESASDMHISLLLDRTLRNIRLSARSLRKRPGFTFNVVLTIALGIGATSAVFSLVDGVLLTPLPYREPSQLVLIDAQRADGDPNLRPDDWKQEDWQAWEQGAPSLESVAAHRWAFSFVVSGEGSEPVEGFFVAGPWFETMGLEPILGRIFQSEADAGTIIIGYDLWQRRFGGDPAVLGQTVPLGSADTPRTIIGVMPAGLRFLPSPSTAQEPNYDVNARVDYWIPFYASSGLLDRPIWNTVARLSPGATLETLQTELNAVNARMLPDNPSRNAAVPYARSLEAELQQDGRPLLLSLFAAAGLVLLIACGNAAVLLLIRGRQRQREYGIISAIGAGPATLFHQVTIEGLVLSVTGGACGIALAVGIVSLFKSAAGPAIPRLDSVAVGWPMLAFGLGAAMLTALLAGVFPAWRASRVDPLEVLKENSARGGPGRGEYKFLNAVVIAQTALSLALLAGAGLLIRTMVNLSQVQPGYDSGRVLTMSVTALGADWRDFHTQALEQISALSGVSHAAFAWGVPLTGNSWEGEVEIDGLEDRGTGTNRFQLPLRGVTSGYFDLLGVELLEGRDISPADTNGMPPVVVVNQAFVDRFFPGGAVIGRDVRLFGQQSPPNQIVGVVSNARNAELNRAAEPEIYASLWQMSAQTKHLVIRTQQNPLSIQAAVSAELRAILPTVAIENIRSLETIRDESVASQRFAMQLLIGFAGVALVLTLVGIYGVISLAVTARRGEIGVRLALGAGRSSILRRFLAQGLRTALVGSVAGVALAVAFNRALSSLLYGVTPTDPLTLSGVVLLVILVTGGASWIPAVRASRVDPMRALREE